MTLLTGNKRAFGIGQGGVLIEIYEAIEDGNAYRVDATEFKTARVSLKITVNELEALGRWAIEAAARRRAGQ